MSRNYKSGVTKDRMVFKLLMAGGDVGTDMSKFVDISKKHNLKIAQEPVHRRALGKALQLLRTCYQYEL